MPEPEPCCCGTSPRPKCRQDYERQARLLRALANPARLQMVDRLAAGECTVGALTQLVGLDQSTVSKHLSVLRACGIVDARRERNLAYYRLLTPCVLDFFACTEQVLRQRQG